MDIVKKNQQEFIKRIRKTRQKKKELSDRIRQKKMQDALTYTQNEETTKPIIDTIKQEAKATRTHAEKLKTFKALIKEMKENGISDKNKIIEEANKRGLLDDADSRTVASMAEIIKQSSPTIVQTVSQGAPSQADLSSIADQFIDTEFEIDTGKDAGLARNPNVKWKDFSYKGFGEEQLKKKISEEVANANVTQHDVVKLGEIKTFTTRRSAFYRMMLYSLSFDELLKRGIIKQKTTTPKLDAGGNGITKMPTTTKLFTKKKPYIIDPETGAYGVLFVDYPKLMNERKLDAYDADGNIVFQRVRIDKDTIDILTKRLNKRRVYSTLATGIFRKLSRKAKVPINEKSAKYKLLKKNANNSVFMNDKDALDELDKLINYKLYGSGKGIRNTTIKKRIANIVTMLRRNDKITDEQEKAFIDKFIMN